MANILVAVVILIGIVSLNNQPAPVSQSEPRSGELFSLTTITTDQNVLDDDRVYGVAERTATSTLQDKGPMTFLDAGNTGTTSLVLLTERANQIDLNWFVKASSTASRLIICTQFSNNGIDWYDEIGQQVNSITEGTVGSPFCRDWTASVTATNTFNQGISPVASKYTKINFVNIGADVGVIIQAVLKELYN